MHPQMLQISSHPSIQHQTKVNQNETNLQEKSSSSALHIDMLTEDLRYG